MESDIGFQRAEHDGEELTEIQAFQTLYGEINECRRGFDSIRTVVGFPDRAEVWASYLELDVVLGELGIPFPVFEEQDPQWNANLLHSLFLAKLAAFARIGALDKARSYRDSEEWKATWEEYAYGPPVGG